MKKLIAIFTILMCVSLMGCATITLQQVSTLSSTIQNGIFDDMKNKELRPFNEIALDAVRAEVDTRFAKEVLGFPPGMAALDGPMELLRQKLALEPSIRGSK
jgi:hypothetical protein